MKIGIARNDGGLSVMTLIDSIQTVEEIDREIAKWEAGNGRGWICIRWEALDDYPPRENRNAYELGRFAAVINEAKIKPPDPDPRDVKIAELEARLNKIEAAAVSVAE